ncbi:hypothetical protein Scep_017043 [Stephania cephalantha]|uniref:Uncharacterized protein n=1 Tax=Stephania cephalantha TaxID=152367 RepID=A0AAP0IPQ8_9MAGN
MHSPTSLRPSNTSASWRGTSAVSIHPTDHSVHLPAAPQFIIDNGVVDLGLEECPLTPSFDEGAANYSGDDDSET